MHPFQSTRESSRDHRGEERRGEVEGGLPPTMLVALASLHVPHLQMHGASATHNKYTGLAAGPVQCAKQYTAWSLLLDTFS